MNEEQVDVSICPGIDLAHAFIQSLDNSIRMTEFRSEEDGRSVHRGFLYRSSNLLFVATSSQYQITREYHHRCLEQNAQVPLSGVDVLVSGFQGRSDCLLGDLRWREVHSESQLRYLITRSALAQNSLEARPHLPWYQS